MTSVRRVTIEEIPEIAEWAIPRFQKRHPRLTLAGMMPLLQAAASGQSNAVRLVCSDNAVGMFAVERTPWEPEPVVCDVFVAGRDAGSSFEAIRIYQDGERWARALGAVEFRYGVDTDTNLDLLAERIGYDRMARNFVKVLRGG
ncbi:MAG TPA: hypothetical protein VGR84_18925 [Candidatus Acidoferrales bacterium]|nr:hypothetical protein [Candidatus Acidoferrales bacterium]